MVGAKSVSSQHHAREIGDRVGHHGLDSCYLNSISMMMNVCSSKADRKNGIQEYTLYLFKYMVLAFWVDTI